MDPLFQKHKKGRLIRAARKLYLPTPISGIVTVTLLASVPAPNTSFDKLRDLFTAKKLGEFRRGRPTAPRRVARL